MSATEIINELPKLTEAERRVVLNKLRELAGQSNDLRAGDAAAQERLEEAAVADRALDLSTRGIRKAQAADLRARLTTFAEDWDRPEAALYDEDSAR